MATILKDPALKSASIDLLSLFIIDLVIISRVIMHELLSMMFLDHKSIFNALVNMVPKFLVHRKVFHTGCLID